MCSCCYCIGSKVTCSQLFITFKIPDTGIDFACLVLSVNDRRVTVISMQTIIILKGTGTGFGCPTLKCKLIFCLLQNQNI